MSGFPEGNKENIIIKLFDPEKHPMRSKLLDGAIGATFSIVAAGVLGTLRLKDEAVRFLKPR